MGFLAFENIPYPSPSPSLAYPRKVRGSPGHIFFYVGFNSSTYHAWYQTVQSSCSGSYNAYPTRTHPVDFSLLLLHIFQYISKAYFENKSRILSYTSLSVVPHTFLSTNILTAAGIHKPWPSSHIVQYIRVVGSPSLIQLTVSSNGLG